jgi:hypothetical protein
MVVVLPKLVKVVAVLEIIFTEVEVVEALLFEVLVEVPSVDNVIVSALSLYCCSGSWRCFNCRSGCGN